MKLLENIIASLATKDGMLYELKNVSTNVAIPTENEMIRATIDIDTIKIKVEK